MFSLLYDMTIWPIFLLLEVVFSLAYFVCKNPGISIIAVSLVVNILVLPLYLKSDQIQADEREKQKSMEGWVKHIRKTFKGDERFMMLSEYYRQNDYQPYYVLKSSLSLLLQIPFFIAAFQFLSNLQLLQGTPFLMIRDLGSPDGILKIGNISVNVLPILMTGINLVSSVIYTKKGPMREKIQTFGMALIFLVLLYNSPSGLVFYWTLNNLFSLFKNIVMSVKNMIRPKTEVIKDADTKVTVSGEVTGNTKGERKNSRKIWLVSAIFCTILIGAVVPLSVITASPLEFIHPGKYADPTSYVFTSTATAAGYFLVWGTVIYCLGTDHFKKVFSRIILVTGVTFLMNYMFFSESFGILWDDLVFSETYRYAYFTTLLNVLFTIQIAVILVIIVRKSPGAVFSAMSILTVSAFALSAYQTVKTSVAVRSSENYKASSYVVKDYEPVVSLSKTEKNVVVLVLDKAIGGMVPYIINERPELAEEFSGFTFYPNTVSLSGCTIQTVPSLYGGYEYAPWNINQRPQEPLEEKVNQGITLLPTMFSKLGYHSIVCDVPYANLSESHSLEIFDKIYNCETHHLTTGAYYGLLTDDEVKAVNPEKQKRRFFFYSLCKVAPLLIQETIYDDAKYLAPTANRVTNAFANSYAILKNLSELTDISDDGEGRLILMHNYMSHEGTFLDPPDYLLTPTTHDNSPDGKSVELDGRLMRIEDEEQLEHYDSNIASYLLVAKWLQTLKDEGVYDNTRIIIVADHGYRLEQFDELVHEDIELDVESIYPTLLVKDFDATGSMKTDDTFMTNADVALIAMEDIIDDPVNPFTGNPIDDSFKTEGPCIVSASSVWLTTSHKDNKYAIHDSHWYTVHDDIFDADNWSIYEW